MNCSPLFIFSSAVAALLPLLHTIYRPRAAVRVTPRRLAILLALLQPLIFAQQAGAAAIAGSMQEAFDYLDGTVFTNGTLNGGVGWNDTGSSTDPNLASSAWGLSLNAGTNRTATSPGLTYTVPGYFPASGIKLTLDAAAANATQNIGRSLGQTVDTGTTYFSLLMSKNTPDTIRTINFAFFNGTTEQFAVGQIGTATGNTGGNFGLLMNNSNPGGLVFASGTPIAMGTGVTHLLIGRVDWNAGGAETVSLWVDPLNVTSEALAGSIYASTSGFEISGITAIRPFTGSNATIAGFNGNAVSANFDEIRLGGTWESVTSAPEPSSATLAFVFMASFGFVRFNTRPALSCNRSGRVA